MKLAACLGVAGIGLMAAATMAAASPTVIAPAPSRMPLLVASPCPPGYQYVGEGFVRGGKYRPARCVTGIRGQPPVAPSAVPPTAVPVAPVPSIGRGSSADQLNREELGRIQGPAAPAPAGR